MFCLIRREREFDQAQKIVKGLAPHSSRDFYHVRAVQKRFGRKREKLLRGLRQVERERAGERFAAEKVVDFDLKRSFFAF